jgi:hypothetical protein
LRLAHSARSHDLDDASPRVGPSIVENRQFAIAANQKLARAGQLRDCEPRLFAGRR